MKMLGRVTVSLGVQRPLIQWFFRKDHYFSWDLYLIYNQQFQGAITLMVFGLQGYCILFHV